MFQLTLGVDASIIKLDRQRLLPRRESIAANEDQLEVVLRSFEDPDSPEGYIMPPQTAATLAYCWNKGFYSPGCEPWIVQQLYKSLRQHDDQALCVEGKEIIVRQLAAAVMTSKWKPGMLLAKHVQTCFKASHLVSLTMLISYICLVNQTCIKVGLSWLCITSVWHLGIAMHCEQHLHMTAWHCKNTSCCQYKA